jgi:hypothetical protein
MVSFARFPVGSTTARPQRSELDAQIEKAVRMADKLGYRLNTWLTSVSPPREPGGIGDD